MSAAVGRDVTMTWGGQALLGIREKKLNCNDEPINISSGEDGGVQVLLESSGEDSIEISLTGVSKDQILKNAYMAGGASRRNTAVLTYPNGATLSGTFQLSGWKEGQPYKEAITFEVTLKSSGAWSFTPGA